jgi:hypothetical protein
MLGVCVNRYEDVCLLLTSNLEDVSQGLAFSHIPFVEEDESA